MVLILHLRIPKEVPGNASVLLKSCFSLSISDMVLERQGSLNLALNPMLSSRMKLRLRASKR